MENTLEAGMVGLPQLLLISIMLGIIILWIKTIIEIANSNFESGDRTTWLLIVIFLGLLGLIIYYTNGRKKRIVDTNNDELLD